MTDGPIPAPGEVVGGKYLVQEMIGQGGMGSVFAARHQQTGKRVALKWLHPDRVGDPYALERFMREAEVAARVEHPNVVDVYDIGYHAGAPFLVMEHLTGEPLSARIERGAMSLEEIADILMPVMRGIATAHRAGVVHRDLKPENVFLCQGSDGSAREPKILDFGISKLADPLDTLSSTLTVTGTVIGTPIYMSPEQLRGAKEVDHRTDIYAVGVILYQALTTRLPFECESYNDLVFKVATEPPRPIEEHCPGLPPALASTVMKAIASHPDERFQNMDDLITALGPFQGQPLPPVSLSPQTPVTEPKRGKAALVAGALALTAGAALWVWLSRDPPHEVTPAVEPPATQAQHVEPPHEVTPAVEPPATQAQHVEPRTDDTTTPPSTGTKPKPKPKPEPNAADVAKPPPRRRTREQASAAEREPTTTPNERARRTKRVEGEPREPETKREPEPTAEQSDSTPARHRTGGLSPDDF